MIRTAMARLLLLTVALCVASMVLRDVNWMAVRQSAPPHASLIGAPAGEWVALSESMRQVGDMVAWVAEVERAEAERAEVAAQHEQQTVAAARSSTAVCEGSWVIPPEIVWRESRCDYQAVNPDGCGGHSCLGAYQFDARHWDAMSGWGACADLGDWTVPESQHECARRLSHDGTSLAPWGA